MENIILNLMIIPEFSYVGASVTTTITEFTALILCIMASSRIGYGISKNNLFDITKILVISLLMGSLII